MTRRDRSVHLSHITFILLFISIAINALQAKKIFGLVEPTVSVRSKIGQLAAPLSGIGLDGSARSVTFSGGLPTVVYFFSPTCAWCERNWPNVRALAAQSGGRFRLLGVASETNLQPLATAKGLTFDIVGGLSASAIEGLGLTGTPHTLVVSSEGRISHEWIGAFEERRLRAVESFFDVDLPGVLLQPKALRSER